MNKELNDDSRISNPYTLQLNLQQISVLIFFAMLFVSDLIANAVFTNRWLPIGNHFVFGSALFSPLVFILGDIVAEIFGCKIARRLIWIAFICLTIFAFAVKLLMSTTVPVKPEQYAAYNYVFGSFLRAHFSCFISYVVSNLINVYLIGKWKIMLSGRYFWLRSLGASTIGEACCSAIGITLVAIGTLPFSTVVSVVLISYFIKVGYSIIFAYPANILVNYLKMTLKLDVYDGVGYLLRGLPNVGGKVMSV